MTLVSSPGFRATVAALATGQLLSWAALYYAFTSFVLPMQRELGWTPAETMGAFTLGLALWGLGSAPVGAAIDRGHGRAVLAGGALVGAAGLVLWALARSLPALYVAWAALGAAMAMLLYDPAFSVLTKRFPDRYLRGITALTLVGGFASTLAFPEVAALLALLDWRGALFAIAAVLGLVVAPLHAWALGGTPAGAPAAATVPAAATEPDLRRSLRTPTFWLVAATLTLHAFVAAALWAHMTPLLAWKGLDEARALAVVVWVGPAQVAGRLAFAALGRRQSLWALGIFVFALLPVAFGLLAWARSLPALLAFALTFGVSNGLVTIVRGGLLPQYFGHAHIGRIAGTLAAIALSARAAAPLAAAWFLVLAGGYRGVVLALAVLGALAVGCYLLAGRPGRPHAALARPSAGAQ
jgi:MFS family permease